MKNKRSFEVPAKLCFTDVKQAWGSPGGLNKVQILIQWFWPGV